VLKECESPPVLEGSLSLLNPHFNDMAGVVLDLGPGTGHLVHYYPAENISTIYGAEPNEGLHGALRANIAASGFSEKYHILSCGAEAKTLVPSLKHAGLLNSTGKIGGVFDTIISARVLCGVPELEETLTVLYALLKPGGKILIVEHVVNPWKVPGQGSVLGRFLQIVYGPFWETFVRCHLDADTSTLLKKVGERDGGWHKIDLRTRLDWSPLPWVGGILAKKML
jgi:SAM-dependent methyltransferase